jgi:site-specific DNA-cytosine methylase
MIMISNINANMSNRMQERDETWTLTTKRMEFGIVEGSKIRSLTPLECERLQGFPEGWTEGVSDTQRYKQLGNAVTVPVIEEIARRFTD